MKFNNKFVFCLALSSLLCACGGTPKEEEKTYNVTLDANGGKFESSSSDKKTLSNYNILTNADLEEPIKNNSTFKGWYLDNTAKNTITFPYTLNKDITIYAGWNELPSGDFSYTKDSCIDVSLKDNIYTITVDNPTENKTPTITLSGCLNNAQLYIKPTKSYKDNGDINIVLNNFEIVSPDLLEPICIDKCNNVVNFISNENTSNYIFDNRSSLSEIEDANEGAISAKSNLKFSGKGSLNINDKSSYQGYSQAIKCSKNVTIDETTLKAYGVSTVVKGNRSITINNSNVVIYSKTAQGLKTSDEDVQDGKRCGDISINGKTDLTIAVAQHGISASHNIFINSVSEETPKINIYTSDYASSFTPISTPTLDEKDMYIYLPTSTQLDQYADQENYRFAVLFDDGSWDNATLKKYHSSGMRTNNPQPGPGPQGGSNGYYFGLDKPLTASTYQIYLFDKNHDANSTEEGNYVAKMSESKTFPTSGDTAKISNISSSSITVENNFGTYDTMLEKGQNPEKASYGCKGLSAGNTININNAILNIKTKDDSIHGKYGKLFPADEEAKFTREIGTGDVNINGDKTEIYITSADDAINGSILTIGKEGNPYINIATSYEGLEGGVINYINGTTSIYARDDGVNGSNIGKIKANDISINVSGGYLDVQVAQGDTDGIDSNNTYNQTGGIVISRASNNSDMSTPLDTDGNATISDKGVFIALGVRPESIKENKFSASTSKGPISKSFNTNTTYKINNTYSFKVTNTYSQYYYYLGSNASAPTIN